MPTAIARDAREQDLHKYLANFNAASSSKLRGETRASHRCDLLSTDYAARWDLERESENLERRNLNYLSLLVIIFLLLSAPMETHMQVIVVPFFF